MIKTNTIPDYDYCGKAYYQTPLMGGQRHPGGVSESFQVTVAQCRHLMPHKAGIKL